MMAAAANISIQPKKLAANATSRTSAVKTPQMKNSERRSSRKKKGRTLIGWPLGCRTVEGAFSLSFVLSATFGCF
jgi:hypothetical protein